MGATTVITPYLLVVVAAYPLIHFNLPCVCVCVCGRIVGDQWIAKGCSARPIYTFVCGGLHTSRFKERHSLAVETACLRLGSWMPLAPLGCDLGVACDLALSWAL